MSNQQHPKQQNRPSLYESSGTTSAFSILSAAQPIGWSKQKSIGISIISFIAGGVLSGSAVGLITSTDQSTSQPAELATATHTTEKPKIIPEATQETVQIVNPKLDSQLNTKLPVSNQLVVQDPLASFKDDAVQDTTHSKTIAQSNHASTTLIANALAVKDDAELQRLIERKSKQNEVVEREKAEHEKLERARIEQNKIASDTLAQKEKSNHEKIHAATHATVRANRPLAHDKDVLLVKSLLDTMNHPLTVNITTRAPSDGSP